ncbi:MAG: universal stress protein [Dehalococcoidia bacterium]
MAHQQTILVPVSNSPASIQAVGIACAIAKARRSKVYVVHVIEVLRTLPLNAELTSEARRAEQVLRRAEEAANHAGYHITGELLQAREAGQAIIDECRDRAIDTIIMGIGNKPVIGEFQLGRTAQFVLQHTTCEVWLIRHGQDDDPSHQEE